MTTVLHNYSLNRVSYNYVKMHVHICTYSTILYVHSNYIGDEIKGAEQLKLALIAIKNL